MVGPKFTLSAAVPLSPYQSDVSGYAELLNYIIIMNYDVWGSWSPAVGPNSPLNDTCAAPAKQQGSAVSGVNAWKKAGFPVKKMVLGVPTYGKSYSVSPANAFVGGTTQVAAYPSFNSSNPPHGDSWDSPGGTDVCGNKVGPGGTWNMRNLVQGGWLNDKGLSVDGISYHYDYCSQTVSILMTLLSQYTALTLKL